MKYFKISLFLIFFGHIAYCSSSSNSSSSATAAAANKDQKLNNADHKAAHMSAQIKTAVMTAALSSSSSSSSSAQAGNTTVQIASKEGKELKELIEHDWIAQPKFEKKFNHYQNPEDVNFRNIRLYYRSRANRLSIIGAINALEKLSLEDKYRVYDWLLHPEHFWLQYQQSVDGSFEREPENEDYHPLRPQGVLYYLQTKIRKEGFSLDQLKKLHQQLLDTQKPRTFKIDYWTALLTLKYSALELE